MKKYLVMKNWLIVVLLIGFYFGYIEQNKPQPNPYILSAVAVVIMVGMCRLMSRVPSKKPEDKNGIL